MLTSRKLDAVNLVLTCLCLSWNPCWKWQIIFSVVLPQIDQMFSSEPPSILSCSSASWQLNVAPCSVIPSVGCSCKHFSFSPLNHAWQSLLVLNLNCNELAFNLSLWYAVTVNEKKMPCLRLVSIGVLKKMHSVNWRQIFTKKKKEINPLPSPPTFVWLCLSILNWW